jgi:hypothetical protein
MQAPAKNASYKRRASYHGCKNTYGNTTAEERKGSYPVPTMQLVETVGASQLSGSNPHDKREQEQRPQQKIEPERENKTDSE